MTRSMQKETWRPRSPQVLRPVMQRRFLLHRQKKMAKTYNSGDSLVVTHLTTNPPVSCLYMAERTGSLIFMILWSYVKVLVVKLDYNVQD